MIHRGKTRIELDLQNAAGIADVIIENFLPCVVDQLGLGPRVTTEQHPRLIYLSPQRLASTDQQQSQRSGIRRGTERGLRAVCRLRLLGLRGIHGALAVPEVIEVPSLGAALSATGVLLYRWQGSRCDTGYRRSRASRNGSRCRRCAVTCV